MQQAGRGKRLPGAQIYLLRLGIGGEWVGSLLWPAVALHGILSLLLARQWSQGNKGQ